MTMLALAVLLLPLLLRRRSGEAREAYNLAVYRDQLAEIERDLARGLLNAEQAEAARAEIGRRILALQTGAASPHPNPPPLAGEGVRGVSLGRMGAGSGTPFVVAVSAVLLLPFGAWLLYP